MFEVKGKYNTAKVYQDKNKVEASCLEQIEAISNCEAYKDCKVRVMADCHTGASSCIGFTVEIKDKIIPATVGVDIGCGMYLLKLEGIKKEGINFEALDTFIRYNIPSGMNVSKIPKAGFDLTELRCYDELTDVNRLLCSIGSLGGGNHFLEFNEDSRGNIYFVVHTGSRNLGKQVAEYYQDLAYRSLNFGLGKYKEERNFIINTLKAEGRQDEIQTILQDLSNRYKKFRKEVDNSKDFAYLTGKYLEDYLHDMRICQKFATLNREIICREIAGFFDLDFNSLEKFETIHNYIDLDHGVNHIIRKGAIAAYEGERVLIPISMAEGSIIGIGRGCEDMNYSAPHGAGRLFSRTQAKENLDVKEFREAMNGVWSSCVNESTLDESPMAYKKLADILPNIVDTVEVVEVIKPVYNFKAGA